MRSKNDDIKQFVEDKFTKFCLDLSQCNPSSLNVSIEQIEKILLSVQENLPSHVRTCEKLTISFQASYQPDSDDVKMATIHVYPPYTESQKTLVTYSASISDSKILVNEISTRPLNNIRRQSLYGETGPIILVIDDDPTIRMIMEKMIARIDANIKIFFADNGNKAMELYRAFYHCSLVFMDFQMPDCDGFMATKNIREFERTNDLAPTPIIGISASITKDGMAKEAGMNAVVRKPLSLTVIKQLVSEHIIPEELMHPTDSTIEENQVTARGEQFPVYLNLSNM